MAASFDEARARVRDYLEGVEDYEEPLLGPVRDAAARLLTEQTAVRDALLAGSPVILDGLRDARAALEAACEGV